MFYSDFVSSIQAGAAHLISHVESADYDCGVIITQDADEHGSYNVHAVTSGSVYLVAYTFAKAGEDRFTDFQVVARLCAELMAYCKDSNEAINAMYTLAKGNDF